MDEIFEEMRRLAEIYQDKMDRKENNGADYVMRDLEVDFEELNKYEARKPFLWLVRRTGTHMCLLDDKGADYLLSRINTWMYFETEKGSGAHYFHYDGHRIKETTLADSIAIMAFRLARIAKENKKEEESAD